MNNQSRHLPSQDEPTARTAASRNPGNMPAVLVLAATLSGCAATGTPYPDVMAHAAPLDETMTRVIFLRLKGHHLYSARAAVIRIDDETVARLAYGGFFYEDLPAGTVTIQASESRKWTGVCEVQLHAVGGDTVYLDVAPRGAHAVATILGSMVGGAAVEAALPAPAIETILVDVAVVVAAEAVAGSIASSVESAGRKCGGSYRIRPLSGDEARLQLEELAWSR